MTASAAAAAGAVREETRGPEPAGSARLLVVEDDAIVARDVQRYLEGAGFEVPTTVRTGEEAVRAARETGPDLVLMDIRLAGEMDGIEAAGIIQEERYVPVIYVSAYTDESTMERVRASASHAFLVKPFSYSELASEVRSALGSHDAGDAPDGGEHPGA